MDVEVRPAGHRRLLVCLGESSTWGTGCSNRFTTWPRRLEHELRQRTGDSHVEVLNAGIPGYTTVENSQLLEHRLLKYEPEVALYVGFRNDYFQYGTSLDSQIDLNLYPRPLAPLPSMLPYELLMRSSLVSLLASRAGSLMQLENQDAPPLSASRAPSPRAESTFRDQVAILKSLCARHGIALLWIDQVIDYARVAPAARGGLEQMRDVLHDELARQGIPLVACHTLYDQQAAPMLDDVHFDDAGNMQLARIIAGQVAPYLTPTRARPNSSPTPAAAKTSATE